MAAITAGQAAEQQETARLAMLAAEEAYRAARRAFTAACQAYQQAKRAEQHARTNPPLFDLTGDDQQ